MTRDIKMVVTDLDGTYLRSDKSISAYTEQVMAKLRQAGILFVVATARPVRAVRDFLPWVQYDAGIFHNGAVVWNGAERIGGTGIEESQKIVQKITREKAGVHVAIEADDRLYANFDAQRIWPGIQYSSTVNFAELSGKVADKLIIEAHSLEEMAQYRKYIPEHLYLQLSENAIAMVMNRQATKTKGIQLLAGHFHISQEQIVAFGDDYNDIDMLQSCGIGVAVGNALEEVKRSADRVCGSNDEDGVAHWLSENLDIPVCRN